MKNVFRFKLEVFNVVMSVIGIILSYSIYCDNGGDWRAKALMMFCGTWMVLGIFGFKVIREFRKEILKRW